VKKLRLAIFDFDGTLADSFPWFSGVLNEVARRHGFREIDGAEAEALRSLGTREILKALQVPLWKVPAIGRDMRAMKLDAAIPVFDGVPEALKRLTENGIPIAMVSSDSEPSIRRTLGSGTASLFSHYYCGASLFGKARKIRQAAKAAGVSVADAIYVGDETRDSAAAREAGACFAAVTWGYSARDALLACAPDLVLDEIADIPKIGA
jgi:phosphoglycolate phosphatase